MERKRIDISSAPCGTQENGHCKVAKCKSINSETSRKRLKNNKSLKDRPCSSRLQVIQRENVRKFAKKKILFATVSRAVKSEGGKSSTRLKRPLLTSTVIKKRQERCTRLLNDLKSHGYRVIIS